MFIGIISVWLFLNLYCMNSRIGVSDETVCRNHLFQFISGLNPRPCKFHKASLLSQLFGQLLRYLFIGIVPFDRFWSQIHDLASFIKHHYFHSFCQLLWYLFIGIVPFFLCVERPCLSLFLLLSFCVYNISYIFVIVNSFFKFFQKNLFNILFTITYLTFGGI